jgi:hypothetical protein
LIIFILHLTLRNHKYIHNKWIWYYYYKIKIRDIIEEVVFLGIFEYIYVIFWQFNNIFGILKYIQIDFYKTFKVLNLIKWAKIDVKEKLLIK